MADFIIPELSAKRGVSSTRKVAGCDVTESWSGGSVGSNQYHHTRSNLNDPISLGSTGGLNTSIYDWTVGKDFSKGKYYQIDVYVFDKSKLDLIGIYLSKDGGTTNIAAINFAASQLTDGWQTLRWHEDAFTAQGTFTNADFSSVQAAIVGVDASGSNTTFCLFHNYYNVERVAEFGIGTDDGIKSSADEMAAIVNAYGWTYSLYVLTGKIGVDTVNYHSWAELRAFQDAGNTLAVHNHDIGNFVVAASTEAEIRADWEASINAFITNGVKPSLNGRFHYGASNGAVEGPAELLQRDCFLTSRRDTYPSSFGLYDIPVNPNNIWGYLYRPSVALSDYLGYIDDAVDQQRGMEFVPHYMRSVDPDNTFDLAITPEDLRAILDHVQNYVRRGKMRWMDRDDYLTDYEFGGV